MFTFNYSLNVLKVAFFALIINVIPAVNEHKKEKMVEHSRAKTLNSIFFSQTIRQSEKKKKDVHSLPYLYWMMTACGQMYCIVHK